MGLDMYLSKKTYIGANYKHRNVESEIKLTANKKVINIKMERVTHIEKEIAYWRKANHIHNLFVTHCQDGVDDCREAEVSKEQLLKLLKDCKYVKENQKLGEKVMPTKSGFFFGGTDYDEYYMQSIEYTIGVIENLILEDGDENKDKEYFQFDVFYQSSW